MSDGGVRKKIVGPESVGDAADVGAFLRADEEEAPRIVGSDATLEDEVYGATLRPRTFEDYVGQTQVVENLRIAIDAAARRGEPLEHVLFSGPPGLGKTTLANLIARATGGTMRPTSGPTLEKPKDLVGILTSLEAGDVLFIDEIHRLGTVVEEYLYPAMEDFQIDFVVDRGAYAKTLKLPLKRFTLVGATTRAGHALGAAARPLRHRRTTWSTTSPRSCSASSSAARALLEHRGRARRRARRSPRAAAAPRASPTACCAACATSPRCAPTASITEAVADEALRREGVDGRGLDRLTAPTSTRSRASTTAARSASTPSPRRSPKTWRRSRTWWSRTC